LRASAQPINNFKGDPLLTLSWAYHLPKTKEGVMKYAILALGLLVTPVHAGFNKYECEDIKDYYDQCATKEENAPGVCLPSQKYGAQARHSIWFLLRWHHMRGHDDENDGRNEFDEVCQQVCDGKLTVERAYSHFCIRPKP
jgi:hypothetical protein